MQNSLLRHVGLASPRLGESFASFTCFISVSKLDLTHTAQIRSAVVIPESGASALEVC